MPYVTIYFWCQKMQLCGA